MLDFVQPHLSGSVIDICEDNEGEKALAETSLGSHCINTFLCAFIFDGNVRGSSR